MAWTDRYFKNIDGGFEYFPYGILGRGYIVAENRRAELRKFTRQYEWASLALVPAVGFSLWFFANLRVVEVTVLAVPFLFGSFFLYQVRRRLAGVRRTAGSKPLFETMSSKAKTIRVIAIGVVSTVALLVIGYDVWDVYRSIAEDDLGDLTWVTLDIAICLSLLALGIRFLQIMRQKPEDNSAN